MEKQIKIYVITTGNPERVDRINEILKGLTFEFVKSVGMPELEHLEKKYRSPSHKFRQKAIMAGEIGCFKTHTQAWQLIADRGEKAIVIEDNVQFLLPPTTLLENEFLKQITQCGLVCFTDFRYRANINQPFIVSSLNEKRPFPTVCYGLTPERAEDLLYAAKKTGYPMPLDKWLATPKLCRIYGYISNLTVARRMKGLVSIANKKRGRKTFNPIHMIFWGINKLKYNY